MREYRHSKEDRTDPDKFQGMYQRFTEVYSDMEKVDSLHLLEHPASIEEFMMLLTALSLDEYVKYQIAEKKKGTPDLEIVRSFMQSEREHQKRKQQLCRGEVSGG